jgi:outer membrane receptor protein involved in Fe transport
MSTNRARRLLWNTTILAGAIALALGAAGTAEAQELAFNIPAESLSQALRDYGRATGRQLIFTEDLVRGRAVAALRGAYTPDQALSRLLKGSGLTAEVSARGAIMIEKAADPASATPETALEEVIVTAEKRAENVQKVPITISVVKGSELADRGIVDATGLALQVPGVVAFDQGGGHYFISIRGITAAGGNTLLTGVYADEIPLSSGPIAFDSVYPGFGLYDLDRVEVLKGPQGTLFGQGAAGGVVRYITNKPDATKIEGDISARLFSTEGGAFSEQTTGMINLPVIQDKLAIRLAGTYQNNGGWITNAGTGQKDSNSGTVSDGRFQIKWDPTDNLSVDTLISAHHAAANASDLVDTDSLKEFITAYNAKLSTANHYNGFYSGLTINYNIGFANILSSTSYWTNSYGNPINWYTLGTPPPGNNYPEIGLVVPNIDAKLYDKSEELRVTSLDGQPLKWVVGGGYYDTGARDIWNQGYFTNILYGAITLTGVNKGLYEYRSLDSWAGFADASYKFFNRLELGGGLRYYSADETISEEVNDVVLSGNPVNRSYEKLTYRAYARFDVTENINIYYTHGTGFRPGYFNQPNANFPSLPLTVNPETSTSDEIGLKSRFLNGKLGMNLAAFAGSYDGQIQKTNYAFANGAAGSYLANAGNANLDGFEWDLTFRPIRDLQIAASGDVYSSRFTSTTSGSNVNVGDPLSDSPDHTLQFSATYAFSWAANIPGRFDVADNVRGKMYLIDRGVSYIPPVVSSQPTNFLQASISANWNQYSFRLFGENLTNELKPLNPGDLGIFDQARPRSIGVEVSRTF